MTTADKELLGAYSYKNEYGEVTLVEMTYPTHISTIRGQDVPDQYMFDLEIAEQLALITDNNGIQLSSRPNDLRKWYVMKHHDESTVTLCEVKDLKYDYPMAPRDAIEEARRPVRYESNP